MRIKLTSLDIVSYDKESKKKIRFLKEMNEDILIGIYFKDIIRDMIDERKDRKDMEIGYGYLVEDKKKLVGFVQPIRIEKNVLDINYAVHPDYRRLGYGVKILNEISSYYFSNNVKSVRLYINKDNIRSMGCALKAGFHQEGEINNKHLYVYMKNR